MNDIGGAPVKAWVLRACIIQGTQQAYVSALWFWGASLTKISASGSDVSTAAPGIVISSICLPMAVLLWVVGVLVLLGLPQYYRQKPGSVPYFYHAITRRKIILVRHLSLFPLP
jgi:alpha-1,3-glucan synthase